MICAIVDERISAKCEHSLERLGFYIIKTKASKRLGEAVKSHPDILIFAHEDRIITSADYCDEAPYIFSDIRYLKPNTKITFTSDILSKEYPKDALFNALIHDGRMYIKEDTASCALTEYARERGLKIIPVKQGYPACTVLSFGKSAITSDAGMKAALEKEGITVTLIKNGGISLPPHEYGFIGGSAGVFEKKVYFLGDYRRHPDSERIESALNAEGYIPVSLSDENLSDLGRIIFL